MFKNIDKVKFRNITKNDISMLAKKKVNSFGGNDDLEKTCVLALTYILEEMLESPTYIFDYDKFISDIVDKLKTIISDEKFEKLIDVIINCNTEITINEYNKREIEDDLILESRKKQKY